MKCLSPRVLLAFFGLLSTPLLATELPPQDAGCVTRIQEISSKLEEAKAEGNKEQQAGLEKALSEVNANCSEANLLKQHEQKVLDAKREVSRRQADLNKAMAKGDPERINKRKDKLAQSRKELQDAQTELEKVQPED